MMIRHNFYSIRSRKCALFSEYANLRRKKIEMIKKQDKIESPISVE